MKVILVEQKTKVQTLKHSVARWWQLKCTWVFLYHSQLCCGSDIRNSYPQWQIFALLVIY